MKPVIFGVSGLSLTAEERDFFRDADPLGYILFKRNCGSRDQMRALTAELRELAEAQGLEVVGTGSKGAILKADYIRALEGAEA